MIKKAEIKFDVGGIKKLLLRFAKLDIINEFCSVF
jgi:hypothetical protein